MGFLAKRSQDIKPQKKRVNYIEITKKEKEEVMDNRISMAEEIINDAPKAVKRIKKDKGLIERTESSKIVLTEDNRQVLND